MIRTHLLKWRRDLPEDTNWKDFCEEIVPKLDPEDQLAAICLWSTPSDEHAIGVIGGIHSLDRYLDDLKSGQIDPPALPKMLDPMTKTD